MVDETALEVLTGSESDHSGSESGSGRSSPANGERPRRRASLSSRGSFKGAEEYIEQLLSVDGVLRIQSAGKPALVSFIGLAEMLRDGGANRREALQIIDAYWDELPGDLQQNLNEVDVETDKKEKTKQIYENNIQNPDQLESSLRQALGLKQYDEWPEGLEARLKTYRDCYDDFIETPLHLQQNQQFALGEARILLFTDGIRGVDLRDESHLTKATRVLNTVVIDVRKRIERLVEKLNTELTDQSIDGLNAWLESPEQNFNALDDHFICSAFYKDFNRGCDFRI